jgi:putative endonuclease
MAKKNNHCIYILECKDGSYYTGYTNNLERRVHLHNAGKGAKYTRGRTPVSVKYVKEYVEKTEALRAEYRVKKLTRQQKEDLIKGADIL